jgi:hypothetical protein
MKESVLNNFWNFFLGVLSFLAIISGFFIEEYKILFWSVGSALLIGVGLGYRVFENYKNLQYLLIRFKKIEESLNIYNRLNKLEHKMEFVNKRGQFNIMDFIKIGLALILIYAFIMALLSM